MPKLLHMPEVAAGSSEAVLQEWTVADNAEFAAGSSIATVETDKALVDIEADSDGVLLTTLVPAGSRVEVGAPIAVLGEQGSPAVDLDRVLADLGVSAIAASGSPSGDASPSAPGEAPVERSASPAEGSMSPAAARPRETIASPPPAGSDATGLRVFTSPLARRLAKEADLPVHEITGTGPGGRIIRRDVEAAIAARGADGVDGTDRHAETAGAAAPLVAGAASFTEIPHSRVRLATAKRLAESKQQAPHFYVRDSARVDELLRLREQINEVSPTRVSVNDLVVKAAARAHIVVPELNVTWTDTVMRSYEQVDVGVAVATDRGLLTPVLRAVDRMPISDVAATGRDLAERAREGRLRQSELDGGALTVTNLGMYGVAEFAAIINPPQSAILAIGAARAEPVVDDSELGVATVMHVTLSVDHRAVDGARAARWMDTFVSILESPVRLLV